MKHRFKTWTQYLGWKLRYRSYEKWDWPRKRFLLGCDWRPPTARKVPDYDALTLSSAERKEIALESLTLYSDKPHPRLKALGLERESDFVL